MWRAKLYTKRSFRGCCRTAVAARSSTANGELSLIDRPSTAAEKSSLRRRRRNGLKDDACKPRHVEIVPGNGYRFIATSLNAREGRPAQAAARDRPATHAQSLAGSRSP